LVSGPAPGLVIIARLAVVVRIALALVVLIAGTLKLARLKTSSAALATFGIPQRIRTAMAAAIATAECALAIGVAAGLDSAAYAAAALMVVFAAALAAVLQAGKGGAPCACFGAHSRVTGTAVVRNLALAGALAAVPSLPLSAPSVEGWLALALAAAFACIGVLGVALLALAREVGILRLRLGPESALDIADEGPSIGSAAPLLHRFEAGGDVRFALAIFSSEGCRLCQSLQPVVAAFRRDPLVAVEVFDELRDADVWRELNVPGSPFAVALGRDGAVHAKGTFNSYAQLESILATAERRVAEVHA
jgi:uncharacterized membrane protein YphA (DoxX/SURF4 family)